MFVFTMLFVCAGSGPWRNMSAKHLPSFLAVAHHDTGQDGGQVNDGVMFGELRVLLLVCFRSVHGWMGMDVCVCECL